MKTSANSLNPFVLMLDPEAVLNAMEGSADLRGLRHRICRPLDKPLIPKLYDNSLRAFDALIEAEDFMDGGAEFYRDAQPAMRAVH